MLYTEVSPRQPLPRPLNLPKRGAVVQKTDLFENNVQFVSTSRDNASANPCFGMSNNPIINWMMHCSRFRPHAQ